MPTAVGVIAGTDEWVVDAGDVRRWAKTLPPDSVHCVVTSPPYYGLRDYGTATWEGGSAGCDHKTDTADQKQGVNSQRAGRANVESQRNDNFRGVCGKCGARRVDDQIGLEPTPDEYVVNLVGVFRDIRRALHPSGSMWLNLADTYANDVKSSVGKPGPMLDGAPNRPTPSKQWRGDGLKKKDLIGVPWLVAFALRADGWYLRQWCPWVKRNPMPESADDRPNTSCETVFLLSKSPDYFFDMEAVKRVGGVADRTQTERAWEIYHSAGLTPAHVAAIRSAGVTDTGKTAAVQSGTGRNTADVSRLAAEAKKALGGYYREFLLDDSRNMRSGDLWFDAVGMMLAGEHPDPWLLGFDVNTHPFKGAHFATFPPKLVRPMVLAGTSARGVCPGCGAPWVRLVEKDRTPTRPGGDTKVTGVAMTDGNRDPRRHVTRTRTVGWESTCRCDAGEPVPAVVCDPFAGSGTTLAVAYEHNRRAVGCELNADYARMARKRVADATPGLF